MNYQHINNKDFTHKSLHFHTKMDKKRYLSFIYHTKGHPAYLSGSSELFRQAKRKFPSITFKTIEKFLQKQKAYNLHTEKGKHQKKLHPKFITTSPFQSISCDLAFFAKNKLVYLMCIDGPMFYHLDALPDHLDSNLCIHDSSNHEN